MSSRDPKIPVTVTFKVGVLNIVTNILITVFFLCLAHAYHTEVTK